MNVVDTSGWLEYFEGGQNARKFFVPIKKTKELIVPTICIYEISKIILRESDENHLLQALAAIQKAKIVDLAPSLSTAAAKISLKYKLPMADSIIYTTENNLMLQCGRKTLTSKICQTLTTYQKYSAVVI